MIMQEQRSARQTQEKLDMLQAMVLGGGHRQHHGSRSGGGEAAEGGGARTLRRTYSGAMDLLKERDEAKHASLRLRWRDAGRRAAAELTPAAQLRTADRAQNSLSVIEGLPVCSKHCRTRQDNFVLQNRTVILGRLTQKTKAGH